MKIKILIAALASTILLPMGVFALSPPTVDPIPSQVDAPYYTLTVRTVAGARVTVVGGPSYISPITDGVGADALDGIVEVTVGLAQEQTNVFSITAEKDGAFSDSMSVIINETSAGSPPLPPGDHTPPDAPVVDAVDNPVVAYEYEITGSCEADANIYVKRPDGSTAGSTQANSNGIFSVTVDLEVGKTNRFNVSAEDAASNIGPATQVVIQAVAPEGPAPEPEPVVPSEVEGPGSVIDHPFTDTIGHWAESYIAKLYAAGYVSGVSATLFDPNSYITRAALAKIVVNVFEYPISVPVLTDPFPDVPKDAWFAPFVKSAKDATIIGGFPDGTFGPGKNVTRAAALKMLVIASGKDYHGNSEDFTDVEPTDWYSEYAGFAQQNGIVSGYSDGGLHPAAPITRAEVVKIAVKLLELK